MSHLLNSYTQLPISFESGHGSWLKDYKGNQYLDLIAGMGVTLLGHAHEQVITAIKQQADKLIHVSNLFEIPQQKILASILVELSGIKNAKLFFTNSGAEAIETAIKLIRLYAKSKRIHRPKIIVMDNSYHGRTIGALSATNNPEYQRGFEPLLDDFIKIPFNDLQALDQLSRSPDLANIVAILLEPIQGESGIRIPGSDYLNHIRAICNQHNWLLILDEIQTGLGRTGKMFCYQHNNILPDVITIAKGLANGIPIGSCIIHPQYADLFTPKSHGSTFGGNPLSCSVAIATLQEIINHKLWEQAADRGHYFLQQLTKKLANHPNVTEIRGKGLMIAIELKNIWPNLMKNGLNYGLLFNVTRNKIIRLLPPLLISKSEIDLAVEKLLLLFNHNNNENFNYGDQQLRGH